MPNRLQPNLSNFRRTITRTAEKLIHSLRVQKRFMALFAFYAAAFATMAWALRGLDVHAAFATGSVLANTLVVFVVVFVLKQTHALTKVANTLLIVTGVIGLGLSA